MIYLLMISLVFILTIVMILPWARPTRPMWLLACLGYIVLDAAVTVAGYALVSGPHWNWFGKAFSIALALTCIILLRPNQAELPLRLPRGVTGWRWTGIGIVAAALFATAANYASRDGLAPTAEAIAYQATMPGLSEELCWRGLAFFLLGQAYKHQDGTQDFLPAAVITTVMFGLIHLVALNHGSLRIGWPPFAYSLIIGAWLTLLRFKTSSVPSLVATHNIANVCGALANGWP
jgi:membrane protease YdiL (CAAX protease family)